MSNLSSLPGGPTHASTKLLCWQIMMPDQPHVGMLSARGNVHASAAPFVAPCGCRVWPGDGHRPDTLEVNPACQARTGLPGPDHET